MEAFPSADAHKMRGNAGMLKHPPEILLKAKRRQEAGELRPNPQAMQALLWKRQRVGHTVKLRGFHWWSCG